MIYIVESITDIVYRTEDKSVINCKIKFAHLDEIVPFSASAADPEDHGVNIYNDILSGKYGPIGDYVAPVQVTPSASELWQRVRAKRNALLTASDYTQMPDYNAESKAAWATYRQTLRDLPNTQTDPANIIWPDVPTK